MVRQKHPTDPRLYSKSAARNQDVICDVLADVLPSSGLILEVGSGSGEHIIHFARRFPDLTFQPTDFSPSRLASIDGWNRQAMLKNVNAALELDIEQDPWPIENADAIISINVIHIAPEQATYTLVKRAAALLPKGAPLFFYGPFFRSDTETVQNNIDFDRSLRARDPEMGIRDLDDITACANAAGFSDPQIVSMPANNLCVVFFNRRENMNCIC